MASFLTSSHDNDVASFNMDASIYRSREGEPASVLHHLQLADESGVLVKISRAVFDDFHSKVFSGDHDFREILQGFVETCQYAVKSMEKLLFDKSQLDRNSKLIFNQLSLELNTYDLMIKMMDAELSANQFDKPTSYLQHLFRENREFRKLLVLLNWNEEIAYRCPSGFSALAFEAGQFNSSNNIYAHTAIRGKAIHVDCCFDGTIDADDEETAVYLRKVLLSLLRCGHVEEAKQLAKSVGLSVVSAFLYFRDFLCDPELTPMDSLHDNFNLAKSRAFGKMTARELITIDDTVLSVDQCIWAVLSGSLSTLLSHASSSDDRLWAYLSCSVDALLDDFLLDVHSKNDEELCVLRGGIYEDDIPKSVAGVFNELRNTEDGIYYSLYGLLAAENWEGVIDCIARYFHQKMDELPAHELRFLTHVVLLLKVSKKCAAGVVVDTLLSRFADLLIEMKLYELVPQYLSHLSPTISEKKMLMFLRAVDSESEQQLVLEAAARAGFCVHELCKKVYFYIKQHNKIENDSGKAAAELLRAWRWLGYGGAEIIWDAIAEANFLLRKFLLHERIAEAMELLCITPENFPSLVDEAFQREFAGEKKPASVLNAQEEFKCYVLYFEAITSYNMWQKHIEGTPAPELPKKLSDEHWARLDIKRRAEYEMSMQKAKDCLQKYIRLSGLLKKKALESLEKVICKEGGWLTADEADKDSMEEEVRERARDFAVIHDQYYYHILKSLVEMHTKSNEPMKVLAVAKLMVNPQYNLHRELSKDHIRKLLGEISKSGAALL